MCHHCRWDCKNCTIIKAQLASNRYIRWDALLRDDNGSINRVYINKCLCDKSKLNVVSFTNQTDWTLQHRSLKPSLFYADKLYLVQEGKTKLAVSIYNAVSLNASINKSVSFSSKLFVCRAGFSLKLDFPHVNFIMRLVVIPSVILISPLWNMFVNQLLNL